MYMRKKQVAGIILLGAGFTAAVIAGLYFALEMQSGAEITDVLNAAVWVFLGILPLLIGGLYLFNQSANSLIVDSDVSRQLRLLDELPLHREVRIDALCAALRWTDAEVMQALSGLVELDLFTGYWNHAEGIVVRSDANTVLAWRNCQLCGAVMAVNEFPVACGGCATTYYLANS
jgi:hypothetical protein